MDDQVRKLALIIIACLVFISMLGFKIATLENRITKLEHLSPQRAETPVQRETKETP